MASLITKADTCYNPGQDTDADSVNETFFGRSMLTSWKLHGSSTVYSGTLASTDGYMITASVVWRDPTDATYYGSMGDYGNLYNTSSAATTVL